MKQSLKRTGIAATAMAAMLGGGVATAGAASAAPLTQHQPTHAVTLIRGHHQVFRFQCIVIKRWVWVRHGKHFRPQLRVFIFCFPVRQPLRKI